MHTRKSRWRHRFTLAATCCKAQMRRGLLRSTGPGMTGTRRIPAGVARERAGGNWACACWCWRCANSASSRFAGNFFRVLVTRNKLFGGISPCLVGHRAALGGDKTRRRRPIGLRPTSAGPARSKHPSKRRFLRTVYAKSPVRLDPDSPARVLAPVLAVGRLPFLRHLVPLRAVRPASVLKSTSGWLA